MKKKWHLTRAIGGRISAIKRYKMAIQRYRKQKRLERRNPAKAIEYHACNGDFVRARHVAKAAKKRGIPF